MFNLNQLEKWYWRVDKEVKGLWIDIIQFKYGLRESCLKVKEANMNPYGGKTLRKYLIPKMRDLDLRTIFSEK